MLLWIQSRKPPTQFSRLFPYTAAAVTDKTRNYAKTLNIRRGREKSPWLPQATGGSVLDVGR